MKKRIKEKALIQLVGVLCNGSINDRYISLYVDISANKEEIANRLSELHGDYFIQKKDSALATLDSVLAKSNTSILTPETYQEAYSGVNQWEERFGHIKQIEKTLNEFTKTYNEMKTNRISGSSAPSNEYNDGAMWAYELAISQFRNRLEHFIKKDK